MSGQIDEKVGSRLRKLLALARDKNGNENEASVAMDMAQALMAEHNITMAELDAVGAPTGEDGRRLKEKTVGRALYEYQRILMKIIAESNFCLCYDREIEIETYQEAWAAGRSKPRKRRGYDLIGRESNVVASREMFDYLNQTMERLVPIASNAERLGNKAISWKTGCARRLGERIKVRAEQLLEQSRESAERRRHEDAMRARHPGAAPSGTALVISLVDVAQREADFNNDARFGHPPGHTAQKRLEREERMRSPEWIAAAAAANAKWKAEYDASEAKMTPSQRKARDEQNERRWARQDEQRARAERQKEGRLDRSALHAGAAVADTISLADQIEEERLRRLG